MLLPLLLLLLLLLLRVNTILFYISFSNTLNFKASKIKLFTTYFS